MGQVKGNHFAIFVVALVYDANFQMFPEKYVILKTYLYFPLLYFSGRDTLLCTCDGTSSKKYLFLVWLLLRN